jgi:hypothetical protein
MPVSPLATLANATITFKRPVSPSTVNETGNFEASSEDFWVRVYLETSRSQAQVEARYGEELSVLQMSGTITEAQDGTLQLPQNVSPRGSIVFDDGMTGTFTLATSPMEIDITDSILGHPIRGVFQSRVSKGAWADD